MAQITCVTSGRMAPKKVYYPVGKSQTIKKGDPLILAIEGTTLVSVVRKVTDADRTSAAYATGVLGIADFDCTTDSNGVMSAQAAPTTYTSYTVAPQTYPVYQLSSIGAGLKNAPAAEMAGASTGYARPMLGVIPFVDGAEFMIRISDYSSAAAYSRVALTLDERLVGKKATLTMDGDDNTDFFCSYSSTQGADVSIIPFRIVRLVRTPAQQALYGTSTTAGLVIVSCQTPYQQYTYSLIAAS